MSLECGHRGSCQHDADCLVVLWGNQLAYWLSMMSHSTPADSNDEAAYRRIIRGVLEAYGCEYRPRQEGERHADV